MEVSFTIPTDQMNEYLAELFSHGDAGAALEESVSLSDGLGAYLGDAGMTILIGLVVVIGTLLMLTGIFYLFGFIMSATSKPKKKKEEPKKETAVAAAPPAKAPVPVPTVQSGISGEVVAAIAAAVAMMAPEGKRYAIKSVSRATNGGRSAWSAAGVADNTRPF